VAEIRVPQIDLKRQHAALRAELLEATERVLTSAWFIMGPEGRALEEELAAASGARYANKDETFVFWNKGDTAFVTEGKDGKETYSGCATK